MKIKIDPEFRDLLTPMTSEVRARLTEALRRDGCRDPLVVWKGHDILLDGHNRKSICDHYGIEYKIVEQTCVDREAARHFIYTNQDARRNDSAEQLSFIRGEIYNYEKKLVSNPAGHNKTEVGGHNVHQPKAEKTSEKLAKEHGVNEKTINYLEAFKMVKTLAAKSSDPREIVLGAFTLTATGLMVGEAANAEDFEGLGLLIERCATASNWWIGDWLNVGEGRPEWGQGYGKVAELLSREPETVRKYKNIAARIEFGRRRPNLSFGHHHAIAFESPEVQDELLAMAAPEGPGKPPRMSVSALRNEVRRRAQVAMQSASTSPKASAYARLAAMIADGKDEPDERDLLHARICERLAETPLSEVQTAIRCLKLSNEAALDCARLHLIGKLATKTHGLAPEEIANHQAHGVIWHGDADENGKRTRRSGLLDIRDEIDWRLAIFSLVRQMEFEPAEMDVWANAVLEKLLLIPAKWRDNWWPVLHDAALAWDINRPDFSRLTSDELDMLEAARERIIGRYEREGSDSGRLLDPSWTGGFLEVLIAAVKIRDEGLFRDTHQKFDDYVRDKFPEDQGMLERLILMEPAAEAA